MERDAASFLRPTENTSYIIFVFSGLEIHVYCTNRFTAHSSTALSAWLTKDLRSEYPTCVTLVDQTRCQVLYSDDNKYIAPPPTIAASNCAVYVFMCDVRSPAAALHVYVYKRYEYKSQTRTSSTTFFGFGNAGHDANPNHRSLASI